MSRNTIPIEYYLDAAAVFHYATKEQFNLLLTGSSRRNTRTEIVLLRLSRRKKLKAIKYGKKLVYVAPRKAKGERVDDLAIYPKIVHGLSCTEGLVRFWRARTEGEIIAERYFYGCGIVPEWGIRYPDGKMLLFEFSTKSNFQFSGLMNGKINAYRRSLEKIEEKFSAKAVVVFVLDVPRVTVKRYVGILGGRTAPSPTANASASDEGDRFPFDPFYFVDNETFLKIPIGEQLKAPIYFWMDGKEYPLTK
jgi:hypothetical protein